MQAFESVVLEAPWYQVLSGASTWHLRRAVFSRKSSLYLRKVLGWRHVSSAAPALNKPAHHPRAGPPKGTVMSQLTEALADVAEHPERVIVFTKTETPCVQCAAMKNAFKRKNIDHLYEVDYRSVDTLSGADLDAFKADLAQQGKALNAPVVVSHADLSAGTNLDHVKLLASRAVQDQAAMAS